MTLRHAKWLLVAVLAGPAAWLLTDAVRAACEKPAAYGLYASSFMDSKLNPSSGEDNEFFTRAGGVPNIFILIDSSTSMRRLPPNGPGFLPGATMKDGVLTTSHRAGVIGCGLDTLSDDADVSGAGTAMGSVASRTFATPCGLTKTTGLPLQYGGAGVDYAFESSACPYLVPGSDNFATAPGWDPDFFNPTGNSPKFFEPAAVFHDTASAPAVVVGTTTQVADGWTDQAVFPSAGSITDFCSSFNDVNSQGNKTERAICNDCLTTRGFFFDGKLLSATQDGTKTIFPSIWYTGNYLNFYPPKFLLARKVLKDVIASQRKIRAAVAQFGTNGAALVQDFNPTCDHPDSNFDANRKTYIDALNRVKFEHETPLAMALFNIGQFYRSPELPWFGNRCSPNNASCLASAWQSDTNKNNFSICYKCQTSSVIVVTDGVPSRLDGSPDPSLRDRRHLPVGSATRAQADEPNVWAGSTATGLIPDQSGIGGVSTADCPECGPASPAQYDAATDYKYNLPRVAWYLHTMDLRRDDEETRDCQMNGGKQTLDIYTVGFETEGADARAILTNTAKVGGGMFVSAKGAQELRQGLFSIFQDINERSTSFSVATVSTLQSQSGHSVIVPRFDPGKTSFWKGHLFRFDLRSEFVEGCTPNEASDLDCDGQCTGAFLVDKEGKYIQEDGTGAFVRNEPDLPSCNQSACGAGKCGMPGHVPAVPSWDAGERLKQLTWKQRKAYTVVDNTGDGRIDDDDEVFELMKAVDDDVYAERLVPYMNVAGGNVCSTLSNLVRTRGDERTATLIDAALSAEPKDYKPCVKHLVRYALGADIFNSKDLKGSSWPPPDENSIEDRDYKLGDIFHSSPVVVTAPLDPNGVLCANGLANQCLVSLWVTPIKHDYSAGYGSAYEEYAKRHVDRRKVVLVGANDGFLHAFDGGEWNPGKDDDSTLTIDEALPPFNGYYSKGFGTELWAFMPPDQLSKVHLLYGPTHQFYVDGTPMVRDVWVDGEDNGLGDTKPANFDDQKQASEFHTIAIVGERRGGRHYFAVDVTNATEFGSKPEFLWMYPQPNDPKLLEMGETYSDFLPVAPPIGPVRVKADDNSGGPPEAVTPRYTDSAGNSVPYREKWVAFLSGGYDPQYVRGRGVYMVDVWTGRVVMDFSRPATCTDSTDTRCNLSFPVASTVAMVAWEKQAKLIKGFANEGYFDTATFGDTGGQLWVLRFNDPGTLSAPSDNHWKATNWEGLGARVFQMGKTGTGGPSLCRTQPFFNVTANVELPEDGTFRVLAGTGDRFNLLDDQGGQCGPDNLRACLQRGCTVTVERASNRTALSGLGDRSEGLTATACGNLSLPDPATTTTDANACSIEASAKVVISSCPSPSPTNQSPNGTTKDIQVTCSRSGVDGYSCDYKAATQPNRGEILSLSDTSNFISETGSAGCGARNWFFSVKVFELEGSRKIFTTTTGTAHGSVRAYDGARLTETSLTNIDATVDNPTSGLADATGNGWAIKYAHAVSTEVDTVSYTVDARNERTSSPTTAAGRYVTWNTTQRTSSPSSRTGGKCDVSKCTQEDRRVHYAYCADVTTGGSCFKAAGGGLIRSIASAALVPPPAPQFTAFLNQKGQVAVGLTRINTETGAQNLPVGNVQDPASALQWLEVTRDLHECRHAPAGSPPPLSACR